MEFPTDFLESVISDARVNPRLLPSVETDKRSESVESHMTRPRAETNLSSEISKQLSTPEPKRLQDNNDYR